MAVYLEPVAISGGGYRISRLRGDTTAELDAFVVAAGITAPRVAHPIVTTLDCYELSWRERRRALRAGAQECDWSETYRRLARLIVAGGPKPVAPGV